MSFILDALKKSESERKRQNAPGIANIPQSGQERSKSRWPYLVAALLGINLVVLAIILLRPDTPSAPSASSESVSDDAAPDTFSEMVREAKRTTPEAVVASSAAQQTDTAAAVPAPTQTVTEGLPTFNDLRASGQLQLPDMHLDIHVYSGQPADRFVFVNMSKYKESATLTEGPSVNEIVPDGVVLDYMGTRFLLPRE